MADKPNEQGQPMDAASELHTYIRYPEHRRSITDMYLYLSSVFTLSECAISFKLFSISVMCEAILIFFFHSEQ
jgi:hypothetical protein